MVAAVTDPYATALEYRARTGGSGTGDDATILLQTTAVSRYLDARLRRFFTQDAAAVTRIFDGNGQEKLWLPADIASITGLIVTVDLDGDYSFTDETALVLDTDFWLGPMNADKGAEVRPFEWMKVHPNSTRLSIWPEQQRAIQITAIWGWSAVPSAIKELCIAITRQLRDMEESGFTLTLENVDAAIRVSPQTAWLLRDIEREYARPPSF